MFCKNNCSKWYELVTCGDDEKEREQRLWWSILKTRISRTTMGSNKAGGTEIIMSSMLRLRTVICWLATVFFINWIHKCTYSCVHTNTRDGSFWFYLLNSLQAFITSRILIIGLEWLCIKICLEVSILPSSKDKEVIW